MEPRNKWIGRAQAREDWSRFSDGQIRCIEALDFAVPMHETYLRRQFDVRGNTIESLIQSEHVRRTFWTSAGGELYCPFLTLTQQGEAVKRDWVLWNHSLQTKLAAIFPPATPEMGVQS